MSDRESYLKRRDQLLMQDERIAELEAELLKARELVSNNLYDGSERIEELEAENANIKTLAQAVVDVWGLEYQTSDKLEFAMLALAAALEDKL